LESKGTALISGDKMLKFSPRPQIDLEDILKFDKVQGFIAEICRLKKKRRKKKKK
jgi:tRNA uridine 5-carboxymethylaminomethyl modification enzyme